MLSCDEIENIISAYYDGELGEAAGKQVEEHLFSCDRCKKRLAEIKMVSSAIKKIELPEYNEEFSSKVIKEIEKNGLGRKGGIRLWKKLAVYGSLAACVALFCGIYFTVKSPVFIDKDTVSVSTEKAEKNEEITTSEGEKNTEQSEVLETKIANENTENKDEMPVKKETIKEKIYETIIENITDPAESDNAVKENSVPEAVISAPPVISVIVAPESQIKDTLHESDYKAQNTDSETLDKSSVQDFEENSDAENSEMSAAVGAEGGGALRSSSENIPQMGSAAVSEAKKERAVYFRLKDADKKEAVENVLRLYAAVENGEGYIRAKILDANYDACLATLRALECIEEYKEESIDGEQGIIQIDF